MFVVGRDLLQSIPAWSKPGVKVMVFGGNSSSSTITKNIDNDDSGITDFSTLASKLNGVWKSPNAGFHRNRF
jgi:hypothetical protein